jgi:hypothetical protein
MPFFLQLYFEAEETWSVGIIIVTWYKNSKKKKKNRQDEVKFCIGWIIIMNNVENKFLT